MFKLIKFLFHTVLALFSIFFIFSFFVSLTYNKSLPTGFNILGFSIIGYFFYKLSYWANSSSKRKCPACKSENVELDSIKEIDRWLGKTKVREKMASGKIRERYMQCTKVKKRYTYCCKNPNCQHTYSEIREEEK